MTPGPRPEGGPADHLAALAERSVQTILGNQDHSGAYVASPNFPVYRYSWFRDGAFIADAMDRAGYHESARAFFHWCRRVVEARRPRIEMLVRRHEAGEIIEGHEYLHTRYSPDGEEGEAEWWNHQLDGYGAWLWALGAHHRRRVADQIATEFAPAVEATARYLTAFWALPCYDCWEENADRIHVSTLAAIAAGLQVAAGWPGVSSAARRDFHRAVDGIGEAVQRRGTRDGHLVKWLGGEELDASLLFCAIPYGLLDPADPVMRATVTQLTQHLVDGGIHRHLADTYFGGGEWVLLTALLGSYQAAIGDIAGARVRLEWVAAQADERGWLPEQASTHLLHPECYEEWEQRWGPVARPLLWSHAMYLNLYRELRLTP